ncbi:MAG: adenylate/guanylate cyclase domain-containing protein [Roseibium sp.]|uniref:adenylate/guanylate cyclase domain-containing protein n=1 Tax=Roseibium sp. TaxID=1936156 RepID=UPI002627DE22|nr:adenylate/guanylate cyclase domain-containing protein [Roseibium sp.]MCV0428881.1 adenylate/guanylate cyclase domain-containing protein [Roseibium sp.]
MAAILVADVVGYSRLVREDEEGTIKALRNLRRERIEPIIKDRDGRVVKLMGDGILAEFPSIVDAVRAAIEIQDTVAQRNYELAFDNKFSFRIGVHLGDVIVDGDDIHGDGVNVAARLESLSPPDGFCMSGSVHEEVRDRLDIKFTDLGEKKVKNLNRPVRVWQWSPNGSGDFTDLPKPAAKLDKPGIAILPFNNSSSDPEQTYFSDGITEDLITEISRIPELVVISRNSSFTYKGKIGKVQDVCRDLNVQYVVEGSVRKAGQRLRISIQLIDGRTGGNLWAERYDRQIEDIFDVQDDVTERVVDALKLTLVGGVSRTCRVRKPDQRAYDYVLRGREQYRLFTRDGNAKARDLFEKAIAIDPDYAEPYAGLSETYVQDWFAGSISALDRAYDLAKRATSRDPMLPLVQEALSTVHLFRREHDAAITTARRWIELEPSDAEAYAALAGAQHFAGQNHEVVPLIETAMRLNPYFPFYYSHYIGLANMAMGRFEDAATAFRSAISRNPDTVWPHFFLAASLGHLSENEDALEAWNKVKRIQPDAVVGQVTQLPYKNESDTNLVLEGLQKAGLSP